MGPHQPVGPAPSWEPLGSPALSCSPGCAEGLGNGAMSSLHPQWRWGSISCKLEEGAPEQVPAGGRSYLRTLDPEGGGGGNPRGGGNTPKEEF